MLIGLVPQHVEKIRPPRALLVPFELGRPLGEPGRPDAQADVLKAAMDLLDQSGPPPRVQLLPATNAESSGGGEDSEVWSCPVSFPEAVDSGLAARVSQEVDLLMPWFDKARAERQHTVTGVSGLSPEDAAAWLGSLLGAESVEAPVDAESAAMTFKLAVEDMKAFYLEAATAQPGGSSTALAQWLWQQTALGELLFELREKFKDYEADPQLRIYALATTVPGVEVQRREQANA